MRQEYDVRRQFVAGRLKAISNVSFVEPEGAFYYFVDCTDMGLKSQNLCDKLLNRYKVADGARELPLAMMLQCVSAIAPLSMCSLKVSAVSRSSAKATSSF